jgi:signal transduction histidine kinase
LNNVFQTILDAAELVSSDPNWSSIGGILLRSVEQGRRIVSSIAEQDHGVVPFEVQTENAMGFALDFVSSIRGPALEFSRDIPPGIHSGLRPSSLERVLVNLFINSAQAAGRARRERCRINIAARECGPEVRIVVSDDGPGIAEHVLPAIFAPRFSTDGARSGLGLHIVESLVSQAGGSVEAENAPAGGAVFTITIPSARPVPAQAAHAIAGASR